MSLPFFAVGDHVSTDVLGGGKKFIALGTAVSALTLHLLLVAVVDVDVQFQLLLGFKFFAADQTLERFAFISLVFGHVEYQVCSVTKAKYQVFKISYNIISYITMSHFVLEHGSEEYA